MSSALWVAVAIVAPGTLYGLHRLGLWMEDRGWVYYHKKRGSSSLATAFLETQALLDPAKRHILEEHRRERVNEDASGDPPSDRHDHRRPGRL